MMKRQASKAASRWREATATSTICSPGASGPTRWMTVRPSSGQRVWARWQMSASAFSVMPG